MNPKLAHEPVLGEDSNHDVFSLQMSDVPKGTGWYTGKLGSTFFVCTHCRTVYQADGDDHGVCPARLHEMLKEQVL